MATTIDVEDLRDKVKAMYKAVADAPLEVEAVRENPEYGFISDSAQGATTTFGVKSVSIRAIKRVTGRATRGE